MYTREIEYTNYLGEKKVKKARFQLTKSELLDLAYSTKGGFIAAAQKMIDDDDEPEMYANYKKIILLAYGEISADGDRFMKGPEISRAFSETPAFDILFTDLSSDQEKFSEFLRQVIPADVAEGMPEKFDADALKDMLNANGNNTPA